MEFLPKIGKQTNKPLSVASTGASDTQGVWLPGGGGGQGLWGGGVHSGSRPLGAGHVDAVCGRSSWEQQQQQQKDFNSALKNLSTLPCLFSGVTSENDTETGNLRFSLKYKHE